MAKPAPSATVKDLFTAAVATYGEDKAPRLSDQWTPVSAAEIAWRSPGLAQQMDNVGFYGEVHVNLRTGEVLIADRGTKNIHNLVVTDVEVAARMATDAQPVADAFAKAGLAAAKERLKAAGTEMSAVYTTGHSLGGAESQGQAAMLSVAKEGHSGAPLVPSGVRIVNVSMDAPGIAGLAHSGNPARYTSYDFSAQGDVIHLAGGDHLAGTTEISLPVGPSMTATDGLLKLGVAVAIGPPGAGTAIGGAMIKEALSNALAAHSSSMELEWWKHSALDNLPLDRLPGMLENQRLKASDAERGTHIDEGTSYNVYGMDKNGNIHPSIVKSGDEGRIVHAERWLEEHGFRQREQFQLKNKG